MLKRKDINKMTEKEKKDFKGMLQSIDIQKLEEHNARLRKEKPEPINNFKITPDYKKGVNKRVDEMLDQHYKNKKKYWNR